MPSPSISKGGSIGNSSTTTEVGLSVSGFAPTGASVSGVSIVGASVGVNLNIGGFVGPDATDARVGSGVGATGLGIGAIGASVVTGKAMESGSMAEHNSGEPGPKPV